MHDQFLDSSQFPHNSPPRSAWGCAIFALVAILAIVAVSALCGGCCNIVQRSEGTYVTMGRECGSPYFCAKHPYYCTAATANDCLAAPYRVLTDDYADWGAAMWGAFATLTYPFWIADEICEIALDTVFLPCDIYAMNRKDAND